MLDGQIRIMPDAGATIRSPHPYAEGGYVLVQPHRDLAVSGGILLADGLERAHVDLTTDPARQEMLAKLGLGLPDFYEAVEKLKNAILARMQFREELDNITPEIPLSQSGFDAMHPAIKDAVFAGLGRAFLAMVWISYGDVNTVTQANYPTRWADFVAKCEALTRTLDTPVTEPPSAG